MEEQEQQLEHIIDWYRLLGKQEIVQSLVAVKQFRDGMKEIQRSAGHSREQWDAVSQAVLDMAKEGSDQ